jgi:putative phosphoesterase
MRIGVISDTHNFFDPKIPDLFAGMEHILHAGDVGQNQIILKLEQIAPVTAVIGNTDSGLPYSQTELVELAGRKFLVHHIVSPRELTEPLKLRIQRERLDAVVFGHTHLPFSEVIGQTLFFNPGYAGRSRFGLPRSVAILHCDGSGIRPEYLALSD